MTGQARARFHPAVWSGLAAMTALLLAAGLAGYGEARGATPGDHSSVRAPGPATVTLTVRVTGNGWVTSTPAGIDCAGPGPGCTAEFPEGETVTLATVGTDPVPVAHWSGACFGTRETCTLTLDGSREVNASFPLPGPPDPPGCAEGQIGSPPDCLTPLPPIPKPTGTTATYDPKTGRLGFRLKCGSRYRPRCNGVAVAVTRKGRKGRPTSTTVRNRQRAGRWKPAILVIKPDFRQQVARMSAFNRRLLTVRQTLTLKKRTGKGRKRQVKRVKRVIYHRYRVRLGK